MHVCVHIHDRKERLFLPVSINLHVLFLVFLLLGQGAACTLWVSHSEVSSISYRTTCGSSHMEPSLPPSLKDNFKHSIRSHNRTAHEPSSCSRFTSIAVTIVGCIVLFFNVIITLTVNIFSIQIALLALLITEVHVLGTYKVDCDV